MDAWKAHRVVAEKTTEWKRFKKQLIREVAIETGIIERLYVWDRGLTETLIEQGIDAALIRGGTSLGAVGADKAKALIHDHEDVIGGLFDFIGGSRELTESDIKELHAALTRSQATVEGRDTNDRLVEMPLNHGTYKIQPNSPRRPDGATHDYCPPLLVTDEMEKLVRWYANEDARTAPHVLAAWLHHRFTQIHPFQDGNGRVARAIASIVMIRAGGFPLVVRNSDRSQYFDALESADAGNLAGLTELFGKLQVQTLTRALSVDSSPSDSLEDALNATARQLEKRSAPSGLAMDLEQTSLVLEDHALRFLEAQRDKIEALLQRSAPDLAREVHLWGPGRVRTNGGAYAGNLAKARGLSIAWRRHSTLIELELPVTSDGAQAVRVAVLTFAIAQLDAAMGVMAFAYDKNGSLGSDELPEGPAASEEFMFVSESDSADLSQRFDGWLEEFATRAIDYWRKKLG